MEDRIKATRLEIRSLEGQKKATRHSIGQLQQVLRSLPEDSSATATARSALLRLSASEALGDLALRSDKIHSTLLDKSSSEPVTAICGVIQSAIAEHNDSERYLRKQLRDSIASYNDLVLFMSSRLNNLGVPLSSIHAEPLVQQEAAAAGDGTRQTGGAAVSACGPGTTPPSLVIEDLLSHTTPVAVTNSKEIYVLSSTAGNIASGSSSGHPSGWTITYPCAKGATSLQLGGETLQLLP